MNKKIFLFVFIFMFMLVDGVFAAGCTGNSYSYDDTYCDNFNVCREITRTTTCSCTLDDGGVQTLKNTKDKIGFSKMVKSFIDFDACAAGCQGNRIYNCYCLDTRCGYETCNQDIRFCGCTYHPTVWGNCNSPPDGSSYCYISTVRDKTLCDTGSPGAVSDSGSNFTWTCYGSWGGTNEDCSARDLPNVDGADGNCGDAQDNGGVYTSPPSAGLLCDVGTHSSVTTNTSTYTWTCAGLDGQCSGSKGSTVNCSAIRDTPPSFASISIRNSEDVIINGDGLGRNNTCESSFGGSKLVNITVTASDVQGVVDIKSMQLRIGTYVTPEVDAINGSANFSIDLSNVSNSSLNPIEVLINDIDDLTGNRGWQPTGRSIKVWDCKVPVSGGFYDNSAGGSCPNFSGGLSVESNFTALTFNSPSTGQSAQMVVGGDATYTDGNNNLVWGTLDYVPVLNADLTATNYLVRLTDLSTNKVTCEGTREFGLDSSVIDPYSSNPSLKVDFGGIIDQEAWFQAQNGGVLAKGSVVNQVPVTCVDTPLEDIYCRTVVTGATNGVSLVAAGDNINKSDYDGTDNFVTKSLVTDKLNYDYFYQQYFTVQKIGTTLTAGDKNWSDIDVSTISDDGVLFINGKLTIDSAVNTGKFLVIIAKNDIEINGSVDIVKAMLIGDNILATGSGNQLTITGAVYGVNGIRFTRSYTTKTFNNTSPAVVVKYNPSLIFSLPKLVSKRIK